VLVNNVLFPVPARVFGDVPFEVWKRKIDVELTGSFFLFKALAFPNFNFNEYGRGFLLNTP